MKNVQYFYQCFILPEQWQLVLLLFWDRDGRGVGGLCAAAEQKGGKCQVCHLGNTTLPNFPEFPRGLFSFLNELIGSWRKLEIPA